MTKLEVTHYDNRGDDEEAPYGYVYFSDGVRLGFAPGTSGLSNPLGLFPSKGWGSPKDSHYKLATEYLNEKGLGS